MADYANLEELKARLDWTLDADEERIAASALTDASNWARHYGRDWPAETAPFMVKTLVLKASQRYMNNPEGYTQSRAGDETLIWNDESGENAGSVYFTAGEIATLRELAGRGTASLVSAPISAWGSRIRQKRYHDDAGYVPVSGNGEDFPMFASEVDEW